MSSDILDLQAYCAELGRRARVAEKALRIATGGQKNIWLLACAAALEHRTDEILAANSRDMEAGKAQGMSAALLDRLQLTVARIRSAAEGLRSVAALPEPVGRILDSTVRPNGLLVAKVAVPLGVLFFIYESRPNVTVDAAGLCVKTGNALILRGGKEALHSNQAIHRILSGCLVETGLPADAVQLVADPRREAVSHLLKMKESIDLVIPRGGEGLIRAVEAEARMHVLKHYKGNCHIYVDAAADLDMACAILLNAKCQRPGVCNAAESLLVHQVVAERFLPRAGRDLRELGVELRGCEETLRILLTSGIEVIPATEADHAEEFLDLILSVKVVRSLDEAMAHIGKYGSGHSESIITSDLKAARRFTTEVDSSAVFVNASTRFNDGSELGLGAEIGISTDKFHARGPCGLLELTTYKYVIQGEGQVRS
jgi:glutamate-5-semialdehyde dehydrogenase